MSGILCVWADLPDNTTEWYETEYVPDLCSRNAIHALHCKETSNGMETESIGRLDAPGHLFTVYEVEETSKATDDCSDTRNHPSDKMLAGPLKDARFDFRTYHEIERWQADDWEGDIANIASVAVMEWRVSIDSEAEVLKFYASVVGPTISSSPDVLRFRFFEIDNATVLQSSSHVTMEKNKLHTFFTLVELQSEQWPWDAVLELAENEQWQAYFEAQIVVKWQFSHYLVKRTYPDEIKTKESNADGGKE